MGLEGKFQDSCNGRAHTGGSDVTESVTKVSRAGKELEREPYQREVTHLR